MEQTTSPFDYEQFREDLREYNRVKLGIMSAQIDATCEAILAHDDARKNIVVVGPSRLGKHFMAELYTAMNQMGLSAVHAKEAFSQLEQFQEECRSVKASELMREIGYNPTDRLIPSKRGRNLKPDESRKARYSQKRK